MSISKQILMAVTACLTSFFFSSAAMAEEELSSRQVQSGTQASAEGINLQLATSANDDVIAVRIQECETCQPTTFLPAPNIEFVVGNKALGVEKALLFKGRGGTVLYNSQNRLAEIVIFYGQ